MSILPDHFIDIRIPSNLNFLLSEMVQRGDNFFVICVCFTSFTVVMGLSFQILSQPVSHVNHRTENDLGLFSILPRMI